MSIGDKADFVARIKGAPSGRLVPGGTPNLDATLAGIASALSSTFALTGYARLQTRISSATEGFLDLISYDFFGGLLPRKSGESDTAFRTRILAELFLENATRKGLIRTLELLTDRTPLVFEPARPADTGGLNTNSMGLNAAGAIGTLKLPYQAFVTVYRPAGQGIAFIAGLNTAPAALSVPSRTALASLAMIQGAVTDSDIYHAIDRSKAAGSIIWTRIVS